MKWILVALLMGAMPTIHQAQTGESPCLSRTLIFEKGPSGLEQTPEGQIVKSSAGDGVAQQNSELGKGETGAYSIVINDFGQYDPKEGAFELGMTNQEGKWTYFTVAPEQTKHQLYRYGKLVGYFEASFKVGDELQVERSAEQLTLQRMVDGKAVPIATIKEVMPSLSRLSMRLIPKKGGISQLPSSYSTNDCPPYAKLKQRLDASYYSQKNDLLRFKFYQRYAIPNGTSFNLPYKIYDWQRNIAQSGTVMIQYGMNWEAIMLSGLSNNTFYTLEIEGNKGEYYQLRFKTKP